jgi:hypothetical protein
MLSVTGGNRALLATTMKVFQFIGGLCFSPEKPAARKAFTVSTTVKPPVNEKVVKRLESV